MSLKAKNLLLLKEIPRVIPLDKNFRSRESIVKLYSDFILGCDWQDPKNKKTLFRVQKAIKAHRKDEDPAVVASTPGHPDDVYAEVAKFVKKLLRSKVVENENQIAFLFPSLKADQVARFRNELEKLDLKVYAPRAGRFIEVEEAVAVFGIDLVATTGIVVCIFGFFSILAAMESHRRLTKFWQESGHEKAFPPISGVLERRAISRILSNGSIFAGGIPLLITLLWLLVLRFVSFTFLAYFAAPIAIIAFFFMIKSLLTDV